MQGDSTLLDERRDRLQYKCQQNEFFRVWSLGTKERRCRGVLGLALFPERHYLPNTINIQPVKIVKLVLQQRSCQVESSENRDNAMSI